MTSSQYAFVITSRLIIVLLPLFADSTTFRTGHSVVPGHHRRAPTAGDVTGSDASTAVHGESASTVDSSAAVDLKCPPCDRIHCWPRRASRLRCPGGIVRGICDCCPVCARLEGQTCGGQWNYLGTV
jgi:hypothetical protein